MTGRSKSFNEIIAKDFEDIEYAQMYLKHSIEVEGETLDEALKDVITSMGMKAFAARAGLSIQAVSDFVAKRQSWSTDKMAKHILQVFKMKMRVVFDIAS